MWNIVTSRKLGNPSVEPESLDSCLRLFTVRSRLVACPLLLMLGSCTGGTAEGQAVGSQDGGAGSSDGGSMGGSPSAGGGDASTGDAHGGGGDPHDSGFIEWDALPPLPDVVETDSWCAPDTESSVDQVSCCNDQPCRGRCYATEDGGVECRCYQLAGGCQQQGLVCCPLYGACTTALSCEHYP